MIDIVSFEKGEEANKKFSLGFSKVYNYNDFNIVVGGDENKNLKALKNKNIDILFSPEKNSRMDKMHSRESGMNHVLCKLARDNKIAIGINFGDILKVDGEKRAVLIGRIMQNIRLCRKYKVKMVIGSFARNEYEMRAAKELFALCRAFGMSGLQAKEALNFKKKESGIRIIAE